MGLNLFWIITVNMGSGMCLGHVTHHAFSKLSNKDETHFNNVFNNLLTSPHWTHHCTCLTTLNPLIDFSFSVVRVSCKQCCNTPRKWIHYLTDFTHTGILRNHTISMMPFSQSEALSARQSTAFWVLLTCLWKMWFWRRLHNL